MQKSSAARRRPPTTGHDNASAATPHETEPIRRPRLADKRSPIVCFSLARWSFACTRLPCKHVIYRSRSAQSRRLALEPQGLGNWRVSGSRNLRIVRARLCTLEFVEKNSRRRVNVVSPFAIAAVRSRGRIRLVPRSDSIRSRWTGRRGAVVWSGNRPAVAKSASDVSSVLPEISSSGTWVDSSRSHSVVIVRFPPTCPARRQAKWRNSRFPLWRRTCRNSRNLTCPIVSYWYNLFFLLFIRSQSDPCACGQAHRWTHKCIVCITLIVCVCVRVKKIDTRSQLDTVQAVDLLSTSIRSMVRALAVKQLCYGLRWIE